MSLHDIFLVMNTHVTRITERGQASIPAEVRRQLGLRPGAKLTWEPISSTEVRVRVASADAVRGPMHVLGFARSFRATRRSEEWMTDLREGEKV